MEHAKREFGLDRLGYLLFDKGFWAQAHLGQLAAAGERFVTPGKNFASLQAAVAGLPHAQWRRALVNQRVAEATVQLGQHTFRLVVWKKLGWRWCGTPTDDRNGIDKARSCAARPRSSSPI